ncbi:F-box/LRR-repeat protein At3g58940-like [Chenopodium quinoa]|uniref:F-box/LRR-repeat protein At3g58940-like n=1 Tax=Chenopodium quinoa TaxID=63459 RepID=UPI000B7966C4|nr:F-box/LRR-repeat protein At3g58940-like [Chenopodium quinoa]
MVRTMNNSRKSRCIKADRISQLPEHILRHILSFVPIKDAARTKTLSTEWKRLLLSADAIGQEPDVCEIRDKFVDFVVDNLGKISQQKSSVLRLSLDVAVFNDEFSSVDELMDLFGKTKVEELCVTMQTIDSQVFTEWEKTLEDVCYEFPYPTVLASNWLESLTIRWCKFPATAAGTFSSLRQLWLRQVMLSEESLSTLGSCCPGIEPIDDYCTFWFETLKLSEFPKLKKASILASGEFGLLNNVDTTETNLENLYYESIEYNWVTSPAACRNFRELTLYYCHVIAPNLFEDFTTAFPLIENVRITGDSSFEGVDWFKATTNNHLRSLDIHYVFLILQKLYVDCPNLKYFRFNGAVSEEVQFVLDEFQATPISQLKHVHLELEIKNSNKKDFGHLVEAFVDGLFWATCSNTLTIQVLHGYYCYDVVKYLCRRLADKKPQNESCCEQQLCHKYWWHNMEDFEVTLGNKDMKEKLTCLAEMVKMAQTNHQKRNPEFRFQWYTIEEIARFLVDMNES